MGPMRRLILLLPAGVALAIPTAVLAHGATAAAPSFPGVLLDWSVELLPVAGIAARGRPGATCGSCVRVAGAHPRNPPRAWRTGLFVAGLAGLAVALLSPVDTYEGALFSVHMVQHMLLELVAAPLLCWPRRSRCALRAASPAARRGMLAVLHSRPVRWLTFPLVDLVPVRGGELGLAFQQPSTTMALENPACTTSQHATFLVAALLFWWPVSAPDPALAAAPPGAPLLPVPGDAPELVPGGRPA